MISLAFQKNEIKIGVMLPALVSLREPFADTQYQFGE